MSAKEKKQPPKSSSSRVDISNSNSTSTSTSTSKPISHHPAHPAGSGSATATATATAISQFGDYKYPTSSPTSQSQSSEITAPAPARLPRPNPKSTNHPTSEQARSNNPTSRPHPRPRSRSRSRSKPLSPYPPIPNPPEDEEVSLPSPDPNPNPDSHPEPLIQDLTTELLHTRETLHLLQTAHATLHSNYLSTDTSLRLLRSTHANCPSTSEVQSRIGALMTDRDAFREAYNGAMDEMRGKDEEIVALRGQVRGLKEWVSSSGRGGIGGEPVTDEVVAERMHWIGNALQNWVISNFRRGRIDLDKASDGVREQLEQLIPMYRHLATASKINFLQSLVSNLLVLNIFQPYFVGLPEKQARELATTEATLGSYGSEQAMNQWRSTTLAILSKGAPEKLKTETATAVNTVVAQLNSLLDPICDVQRSEVRDQSLKTIIHSAIDLSRLLRVQKAVFSIMMPMIDDDQRMMFDEERMEDIGGEDEDGLNEREISCVTFPGIMKAGDENGERNHLINIVAKMKVLCAPTD
ncbi:hypothetical protein DSL72_002439 [Monilinia vaccinii-corymbosi]|uniref:Involucrin repeat protein n=1 Tax=Monilinia vaccinii-corymbosi TaxID=61207 RepID=A0A8A3PCP8_9HELO|nr:hypothetical protein DSL72_002439 [Monilinia vaccinii-corymbosi]